MNSPTIGILAGMGPRSTAPFIDQVITECQVQYGAKHDIDFPKMMICSLPAPFHPGRPTDHAAMEATIRGGLQDLVRSGADFIAIPCNTAHVYYPQLAKSVDLPLLNMVELALDAMPAAAESVALVAARPTIESGIYQDGLRARGRHVVDIDWQGDVDALIGSTRTSQDPALFRSQWARLTQRAATAGADTMIIACMDLTAIKSHIDTALHVLDAGQCLAAAVVRRWMAERKRRAENAALEAHCE